MDYLLSVLGLILIIWGIILTTGFIFLFIFLRARFEDEKISADADDE